MNIFYFPLFFFTKVLNPTIIGIGKYVVYAIETTYSIYYQSFILLSFPFIQIIHYSIYAIIHNE